MKNLAPTTWKVCTNQEVLNVYQEVLAHAKELRLNVGNPKLYTFKSTHNFGRCITNIHGSVIGLNEEFLKNPIKCRETCIHELAHAIVPKSHHDWRWEEIGNKIGAKWGIKVSRLSSEEKAGIVLPDKKEEVKYIVKCPTCGCLWKYQRLTPTVRYPEHYRCGKCKTTLERIL